MATVNWTTSALGHAGHQYTWTPLTPTNADGLKVDVSDQNDFSVLVVGTWGGSTVTWQGSADGTNFYPLHDVRGAANQATHTADATPGFNQLLEHPRWIRPILTGGAASSLTAYLFATTNARG